MSSNASDFSPFAGDVSQEKGQRHMVHTKIEETSFFHTNNDKSKSDKSRNKSKDPKKTTVNKSSFGGVALNVDFDTLVAVPKEKKSLFPSRKKKHATPSVITELTADPSNTKSLVATPVANSENTLASSLKINPSTTSSHTLATKDHGSKSSAANAIVSIKSKDESKTHPSSISPFLDKPKYKMNNAIEDVSIFHKAYKHVETNTSIAQSSTQTSNELSSGFQFRRVPKKTDKTTVLPESTNQCSKVAIQGAETDSPEVKAASKEESNTHLSPISKKEESQCPQRSSNSMHRSDIRRCVSPVPITTTSSKNEVPTIANHNHGSKSNHVTTSPTLSPKRITTSNNVNHKNLPSLLSLSEDDALGPFVPPSSSVLSESVKRKSSESVKRQSSAIIDLQPTESLDSIIWGGSSVAGSVSAEYLNIDPVESAGSEAMDSVIWGSFRSSSLKERIPSTLGFFENPDRAVCRGKPQVKSKTMPSSISPHIVARHDRIEQGQEHGGGEVRDEVCLDDIRFIRSASSELRFDGDKYEVP